MGDRVWEVQKELEELQQRSLSGPQVQPQSLHIMSRRELLVFGFCIWIYIKMRVGALS